MNGQDLRIFARDPSRSTLNRPARPRRLSPPPLVRVVESPDPEPPQQLEAPVPQQLPIEEPTPITRECEPLAGAIEQRIFDILSTAPAFGETIDAAYRRKERELADVFAALTRIEASTLQRRLTDPHAGDTLASRFARLVIDRRTRLLNILADTPRRLARR